MEDALMKRRKLELVQLKTRRVLRIWKKNHDNRSPETSRNVKRGDIPLLEKVGV